ncbi:hypothetical protein BCV72DRAFT_232708 [Rhizopus microsporus var. microsporus]|uniref:Velvet domain-containing protein n=3 Tax=Rhizopus microsporus TaxID=58291 RepID=A0A2G4T4Z1_RHIZD|nr:uncharacterized protein RHIMIDRAFT_265160 [Rhizopus microsporus ATCC 52813]ORE03697.1 hypothetical protein BCV72DRAFT_232708 [Rhizopus microsporus var. microsporus]PHZ16080.1 hypothetical protein RHIMIDRAFT_265160 [Rhizopus microsporus ATCC 52813]
MCVTLIDPDTLVEIANAAQNTLSGQTSSSMYKLKDINNQDGGFFIFGDLSVKVEGQFRLKFSMFKVDEIGATNLKSIYSDIFQVYPSKNFPGMLEPTFLSRSFSDQGARIRIRKEHRVQMTSTRKRKLSFDEESTEESDHTKWVNLMNQARGQVSYLPNSPYPTPASRIPNHTFTVTYNTQWHIRKGNNEHQKHDMKETRSTGRENMVNAYPPQFGRRTSVPFSPPHQFHDPHLFRTFNTNIEYCHDRRPPKNNLMPSPPLQTVVHPRHEQYRRSSYDERSMPLREQANDMERYQPFLPNHRRMSLQTYPHSSMTSSFGGGPIHLPPLRSVVPIVTFRSPSSILEQDEIGEVDAAVAMMQLASLKKQKTVASEITSFI